MVPGNDGHHEGKIKDSNMEDRYWLLALVSWIQTEHMMEGEHASDVRYGHSKSSSSAFTVFMWSCLSGV